MVHREPGTFTDPFIVQHIYALIQNSTQYFWHQMFWDLALPTKYQSSKKHQIDVS